MTKLPLISIYPVLARQTGFPVYLSGIGVTDPEYHIIREQGLVSHQILFTLEGEGRIRVDGKKYEAKPGTLFYVASGVVHEYYPLRNHWKTCWMVFRGEYLSDMMTNLGFAPYMFKKLSSLEEVTRMFGRILAAARDPVYAEERCSVLVYEYIMAVRRMLLTGNDRGDTVISQALIHMDDHFSEDIALGELAESCGITQQHLCRVFKKEFGMRPLEYLARKRIARAKSLLYTTDYPVAKIGQLVGYSNPTYFGQVFKDIEGCSPREYRKSTSTRSE